MPGAFPPVRAFQYIGPSSTNALNFHADSRVRERGEVSAGRTRRPPLRGSVRNCGEGEKPMSRIAWHDLRAPELRALAEADAIVIIPVGSTEQHGPHLPVQVDARLAAEVANRAAARISEHRSVVVAPTVWCGLAEHHMAFGATITLDFATFHALIRCVCESIQRHGFRRLALLNGHGGNIKALDVIAGELKRELGIAVVSATYWTVERVARAFGEILDEQPGVAHACEAETSMMLALEPALVDREEMARVDGGIRSLSASGGLYRFRGFDEMTESGVMGVPAAATAEKGERLLAAAAEGVAEALLEEALWQA